MTPSPSIRVGVYGGSGSTGTELVGWLVRHPAVELAFMTSREHAGRTLRTVDPAAPPVPFVHPDDADPRDVEVVFCCLPHGRSADWVKHCRGIGPRVIDLSGDLRLHDPALHRTAYGTDRDESLAAETAYGLTELEREAVTGANVVANPGCYPTCTGLALAPIAAAGRLAGTVVVNALSGVSGAGRAATAATHFCAVTNDVRPYKLGRGHRHVPEIEQIVRTSATRGGVDATSARIVFAPHVIPIERGMLATITLAGGATEASEAHDLLDQAYRDEPFVQVLPEGEPARIRGVVGTNHCEIGVHAVDGGSEVVITSAIDNLVKGAAGQAIQNLNAMLGLPETTGIATARTPAATPATAAPTAGAAMTENG